MSACAAEAGKPPRPPRRRARRRAGQGEPPSSLFTAIATIATTPSVTPPKKVARIKYATDAALPLIAASPRTCRRFGNRRALLFVRPRRDSGVSARGSSSSRTLRSPSGLLG